MIERAIKYLKERGIESFELMGILTIPIDSPDKLDSFVSTVSKLLKECGYNKSWRVDPYYYERHSSVEADIFDAKNADNIMDGNSAVNT